MGLSNTIFEVVPPRARQRLVAQGYKRLQPELRRLPDFVPRGCLALDVGAWWGPWTFWLARQAGQVHTFEPVPHIAEFLRTVSRPNVTIHEFALSDVDGVAGLSVPDSGVGAEGRATLGTPEFAAREVQVQVRRLDDVELPGRVGFVKIDVEGHELAAVRGARQTLERDRPNLLIEVEAHPDRPHQVEDAVSLLTEMGFEGSFLRGRTWVPMSEFDVERDQTRLAETVRSRGLVTNALRTRGYIHNFLFRPKGGSGAA